MEAVHVTKPSAALNSFPFWWRYFQIGDIALILTKNHVFFIKSSIQVDFHSDQNWQMESTNIYVHAVVLSEALYDVLINQTICIRTLNDFMYVCICKCLNFTSTDHNIWPSLQVPSRTVPQYASYCSTTKVSLNGYLIFGDK